MPLYAALPVLDSRLGSAAVSDKTEAHNRLQFWAMLLTLVSWCSLIIAAAMAVGIYLSLRDRNSAPLRALAQSIRNMASGDLHTSIWGMERSDMVGELARAVDIARYTFSHMPDVAVMSDQGPIRLRFEGKSRSLFDGMMQVITRDSEQVRAQATSLTDAITRQQEAITLISSRVEAVLHNVEKRGLDGDQQVRRAVQSLVGSAQSLKNAQEHSASQLGNLVPYLQERAQGMAEIAQITGKQIAQVLQSLTLAERDLKASASQSGDAVKKLSSTTDELSSRLFGAVNLLQASGKVLSETTEKTQNRLNEAIIRFAETMHAIPTAADVAANAKDSDGEDGGSEFSFAPRISEAIDAFENAQQRLEERIQQQTFAAQAQIELLSTQSSGLLAQTATTVQTLSTAADQLRDKQAHFDDMMQSIATKLEGLSQRIPQPQSGADDDSFVIDTDEPIDAPAAIEGFGEIAAQVANVAEQIAQLRENSRRAAETESQTGTTLFELARQSDVTNKIVEQMQAAIGELKQELQQAVASVSAAPAVVASAPVPTEALGDIASQVADVADQITQLQENSRRTAETESQTGTALSELARQTDTTSKVVEQMRSGLGELARWLEQAVIDLKPAAPTEDVAGKIIGVLDQKLAQLKPVAPTEDVAGKIIGVLDQKLAQLKPTAPTEDVAGKIIGVLDQKLAQLKPVAPPTDDKTAPMIEQLRADIATLSEALAQLDTRPSKELIQDVQQRWFQMAAQIEATRTDLMLAITQQVDRLEMHFNGAPNGAAIALPPAGETQKQIEQQTQILSELVATLGVLDAHMQQLKSEVRSVRN